MSLAHRTINNAIFNLFGWLLPVGLNLLALPYIVDKLGEEAFGVFTLVLAALGFLSFLDLGLNTASIKYIAECWGMQDDKKIGQVVGATLLVYAVVGGLGTLTIGLSAGWLTSDVLRISPNSIDTSKVAFQIAAFGFLTNMIAGAFRSVPIGLQRFDVTNKMTIGFATLSTLSTIIVLAVGGGLLQVVIARLGISCLSILGFLFVAKRLVPSLIVRPYWDRLMLKQLMRFGGLSAVNGVAAQLIFQLNRLLIGFFLGATAVTYYAVPANLTSLAHTLLSNLTGVLFPLSSDLSSRGEAERLQKMYTEVNKYIAVLATLIYLPLILFASPLLSFWMGLDFANQSGLTLSVLALSYYALSFNATAFHVLNGMGKPGVNALYAVAGGLLNLGSSLILIPKFGILGAAVANLINMVRIPVYILQVNGRVLKISNSLFLIRVYVKPLLIAGGIAMFFILTDISPTTIWGLLGMSVALVALYLALIMILGVIDANDRAIFSGYIQSTFQAIWPIDA